MSVEQTESNTQRVGLPCQFNQPRLASLSSVLLHSLSVYFPALHQLFAKGVAILPPPATHPQNAQHANSQKSRTRIKLSQIRDDIMSSPAGPSRIGGLGPRHRRPPTVEPRAASEDSDEEHERLTTNFNHPVSASTCRF